MDPQFISLMIFLPVAGALLQAISRGRSARWMALAASLGSSVIGAVLVCSMNTRTAETQIGETLRWVSSYAINYDVGIDGLNALLVLLVSFIFPVLIASEWQQKGGVRGLHALFLLLQTAFLGTVCAQDLFLQAFFWGLTALPFYFLIGIWGGEGRESAASRSMVVAAAGNALFFCALVLIYYSVEPHSFSLHELAHAKLSQRYFEVSGFELSVASTAFALVCGALALRAPIWPLHGWFVHCAQEARPSVFVALSAVGAPVATYIFIRLAYSLFPQTLTEASYAIISVGLVNLVIGGVCAVAQKGLKLLLAFVCLSEIGLILVGVGSLNPAGVVGAVYEQLVLGLGLAGFGLFTAWVAERVGHADFLDAKGERLIGGLVKSAPLAAVIAGIIVASLLGFPGSGGFVGHALLVIGSFSVSPLVVILAVGAGLLAVFYLFSMYRHVFLGKPVGGAELADLSAREQAYLFPLVAGLLVFGLYPKPWIDLARPTILTLLSMIK